MIIDSNWPVDYFPSGWAGLCTITNTMGFGEYFSIYENTNKWINLNIKNPTANSHWCIVGDCCYYRFRRKDDMIAFLLAWPAKRSLNNY